MKKINLNVTMSALGFGLLMFAGAGVLTANAQVATLSPQSLPDGTVSVSYSETISATPSSVSTTTGAIIPNSDSFVWSLMGSLPPGLSLDTETSESSTAISGTPTTAGQYSFTVSGLSNGSTSMQSYVMNVDANTNNQASTTTTNSTTTTTTITTGPNTASATIQAQLDTAQTELMALEAEMEQESPGGVSTYVNPGGPLIPVGAVFSRDLTIGSTGADVQALQEFLNQNNYPVAASGPGSSGNETDYFGTLTQAALASYQAANGISPAQGYYGSITRAKIGAQVQALSS